MYWGQQNDDILTRNKHGRVNLFINVWYFTVILWIYIINSCCDVNCPNELFEIMGNTSFSHFDAPGMKGLMIKNAQGFSLGTLFKNHHIHPSYNKSQRKNTLSAKTRFSQIQAFGSRTNIVMCYDGSWLYVENTASNINGDIYIAVLTIQTDLVRYTTGKSAGRMVYLLVAYVVHKRVGNERPDIDARCTYCVSLANASFRWSVAK